MKRIEKLEPYDSKKDKEIQKFKVEFDHGPNTIAYTRFKVGEIYNGFKIIEIGKYIYKTKTDYEAILKLECTECGKEFYIRERDFLRNGSTWKCTHKPVHKNAQIVKQVNTVGKTFGDLTCTEEIFVYGGTNNPKAKQRIKLSVCSCSNCNGFGIAVEASKLSRKEFTQCGCLTPQKQRENGGKLARKIGDIVNEWKILRENHREQKEKTYVYYECECQCCGEKRIIGSKFIPKQKCEKRKKEQIDYIKSSKEKLIYSLMPEFAPNLIGLKVGTLEVISYSFHVDNGHCMKQRYWLTKCCVCGKISCHYEGELVREEIFSDGCLDSFGELRISNFLLKQNVPFVSQKFFEDCKDTRLLPYDFYVYNSKEKEWFLLEFQGVQHTNPRGFGDENAEKKFKDTQRKDKIKAEYAKDHNIRLEFIYYEDLNNIEKILCNILGKKFSIKMIANVDELQVLQKEFKKLRNETTKEKKRIRKTKEYKQQENHKAINFVITDNQIVREEDFNNAN